MKNVLAAIVILTLSLSAAAQPRSAQQTRPDLMSTLLELDRAAASTNSDIGHLQIDKWKGGWKTGFTTSSSHKNQAAQSAQSLQRNLKGALPELIRDAMNSRGNISTTFKVYEDLNLVLETLDALVDTCQQYGKREEYNPLANDYNTLVRLRRTISGYIQQKAAAADGISQPAFASFSSMTSLDGQPVRKIIIDDAPSEKKRPAAATTTDKKKKQAMQYSNVD